MGFADDTDLLLVVSSAGRGLFDLISGERVARDPDDTYAWFDAFNLRCRGLGSSSQQWIRTAGLSGGGLAHGTADGWRLEQGNRAVSLLAPFAPGRLRESWQLEEGAGEFRAAGFSPTGRTLIYASSADLAVYRRVPSAA